MKKLPLLAAGAGLAAAGLAFYSYLDLMYKESIPKGPARRILESQTITDDALARKCAESMKWVDEQPLETVDLKNDRGETLKGYLLMAPENSKTFAVFAHGYRASYRGDPANFYRYYYEKGINFFTCDHTAHGASEGDWVGFDVYESRDMLLWLNYLTERFGDDIQIILHGVSMGGATVCQMANKVPKNVKLIVADCPYTGAVDEFLFVAESSGIKKSAPYILKVINAMNKGLAGYDLAETDVRESVKNAGAPMLFVHGTADDFVPTKMGKELYELCSSEKELLLVDGAKHAESVVVDADGYYKKLDEVIEKYL